MYEIIFKTVCLDENKVDSSYNFSLWDTELRVKISCPCQTRTRVALDLTSESLYESFLNSHVLVKREQELHES